MNSKQKAVLVVAALCAAVLVCILLFGPSLARAVGYTDYSRTTYGEGKAVVMGGDVYDASHKTTIDNLTYSITPELDSDLVFEGVITASDGSKCALIGTSDAVLGIEEGETLTLSRTIFRDTPQQDDEEMLLRVMVNITFIKTAEDNSSKGYFQVEVTPVPEEPQVRF